MEVSQIEKENIRAKYFYYIPYTMYFSGQTVHVFNIVHY